MPSKKIDYKKRLRLMITYLLVLLCSTLGLEFVKSIVTGTAGPTTRFVTWCVLAPCALVGLGFWFDRISGLLSHALVLALLGLIIFLNWPLRPAMDFQRQLVSEIEFPLLIAFAVCGVFIRPGE